jgi:hypothetical protein
MTRLTKLFEPIRVGQVECADRTRIHSLRQPFDRLLSATSKIAQGIIFCFWVKVLFYLGANKKLTNKQEYRTIMLVL